MSMCLFVCVRLVMGMRGCEHGSVWVCACCGVCVLRVCCVVCGMCGVFGMWYVWCVWCLWWVCMTMSVKVCRFVFGGVCVVYSE